jgi:hypothetical protein
MTILPGLNHHLSIRSWRPWMLMILCLWGFRAGSQDIPEFREFEDSLVVLSETIFQGKTDAEKYHANELFINLFSDALSLNNSFKYPFDSLKLIKILVAPDRKFRIMTWMIAREEGTYEYFGFIQSFSRRKDDYEVYPLTDLSEQMEAPETKVLDHKNWYGAVYYEIILTRDGNSRYYTLLGWDGNNPLIRRKIIEVITLRSNGMPRFGQSLFRYNQSNLKRIIFEYSSLATMNLRYEEQHYLIKKRRLFYNEAKNAQKRKKKAAQNNRNLRTAIFGQRNPAPAAPKGRYRQVRKAAPMIIFDNLVPLEPGMVGQRQFYVPEGNIVSGFRFTGGKWRYMEDIDARNPRHRYDKEKNRPKPELIPSKKR